MIPAATENIGTALLIVDDEPANVRFLEQLLARAGYLNVTGMTDSSMVLAFCVATPPDIILLDLHMAGMDRLGVLRQIRGQIQPEPFVVMLTGDASTEARLGAFAAGARDFISKPFDIAEVLLRINNLLELRSMAVALRRQNAMLESNIFTRTRELEEARLDVIERLALAAEVRDDVTGQHIRRVGDSAGWISAELGLTPEECQLIRRAAPLHDVGKIAIPDSILLKRGPLTPAERTVMETHTTVGARVLSGSQSPLLQTAQQIALHHHERWDGTGYPTGLGATQIPAAARVVAVADFYDALVHDRPYRPALSHTAAMELLGAGSGTHFDPDVVRAFNNIAETRPRELVAAYTA